MIKKYSIGLDIGVSSVGWVCMTPDYKIPKYNGRYAMGVREFESAETAEARRTQRGTRRRYNRRIKRIQLLQQTMSPLFNNDPGFFIETDEKEKHFWRNSNQFENKSLSETLNYLRMDTRKYPTIYHLRNTLRTSNEKFHPRLIYLALHHLVKYRGHFLNENMTWNDGENSTSLKEMLKEYIIEFVNVEIQNKLSEKDWEKVSQIIESDELNNSDKRTEILKIIGKELREHITLILGLKTDVAKLFPHSNNSDTYKNEKLKLSFSEEDITEVYEKLADEEKVVVEYANKIYQNVLLKDLLGNASCVAEAKVLAYKQFGEDLTLLKSIYNDYFGEKNYRSMFITTHNNKSKYNQTRDIKLLCEFDKFLKVKKEEDKFYNKLKKDLNKLLKSQSFDITEERKIKNVIEKLDHNQFLQKQKAKTNAAIPHQNNVFEAEMILRKQQTFYPEITDEMIKRVKDIISFRIPYYIGPLVKNAENAKFGWASRIKEGHVKPWTIDEIIDYSKSAEDFINRMTNYCAYLTNEKVLPKNSLLYQKFELLNELNGIQIRKQHDLPDKKFRLGKDEKLWLIEHVFKKYKSVTHSLLKRELKRSPFKHLILDEETDSLKVIYGTQLDNKFGSSLSSYIDMKKIFGDLDKIDTCILEELIYWITVFEEKDIIEMKIKEKYPQISEKQISQLINLNYSAWGRLSKRLINELPADKFSGQTILDIMESETKVFMEVLTVEKYDLKERITKMNQIDNKLITKIKYKDIEDLQGSPAIKKGIWQAVLLIEELVEIFGEPENIMIEFAREEGEKVRTKSRKRQINDIQKAVSCEEKELKQFLKEHSRYEEAKYQENRLYLYITQQGKCLYSGERLNISRLQDYEVDHILPKSFVKDDSIDNLALVKKHMNQAKGDEKMPLQILNEQEKIEQRVFWKKLHKNGLISKNKYFRLMKEGFTDQDKESFFARQLVETRQITRHVKDLLNERFENTEIHAVNANIVSNLRKHSQIIKIRELNNKHHAVDAALAVLIVQFIINKYGVNFLNFNFKYQKARKKWRHMLKKQRKNFFLFSDIDKYDKFTHFQTGELLSGRKFLSMINDELPWQTTKKIGTGEAAFYDQTLYSPKETRGRNPQYKSSKLSKGVHSDLKVDCSYLISYKYLNNKHQEKFDSRIVDFRVIEKYQTKKYNTNELAFFLANKVKKGQVIEAKIHCKILKHQLVLVNNHPLYFVSSGEMNNAKQFRPKQSTMDKLYYVIGQKEVSIKYLRETFKELTEDAIKQFEYLSENRIRNIKEYKHKIVDMDSFNSGIRELFKMASASAARSKIFGGRYERKLNPLEARFVHQSVTGLKYRKPISFRNKLWSK